MIAPNADKPTPIPCHCGRALYYPTGAGRLIVMFTCRCDSLHLFKRISLDQRWYYIKVGLQLPQCDDVVLWNLIIHPVPE